MEEDRLPNGGGEIGNGDGSVLLQTTGAAAAAVATLSLPLTRYTTRFFTGDSSDSSHHRQRSIILGDCADVQSSGHDGENCTLPKPIMVLDLIWNLAFVLVLVFVLLSTMKERPSTPLRVWLCGYALQCLLHVGFVYLAYQRRNQEYYGRGVEGGLLQLSQNHSSFMKSLESMNTMISSVWWVFGFYWIVVGGQALLQDSPRLYWLTVVFLAFDVFFIIFCIGMACIILFALFCCIPLVALACAVATREGASENDIRNLPKYRYRQASSLRTFDSYEKQEVGAGVDSGNYNELALHPEDSECCICLSRYVDGAELYRLPCNHHFHCGCIGKWLRINATCPLCKFNILRGDTLV